jgi:hypothetical protein
MRRLKHDRVAGEVESMLGKEIDRVSVRACHCVSLDVQCGRKGERDTGWAAILMALDVGKLDDV